MADEWVTQLLRQVDAKVFKKHSQMKLQMKREVLAKLNRRANEGGLSFAKVPPNQVGLDTVQDTVEALGGEDDGAATKQTLRNQ